VHLLTIKMCLAYKLLKIKILMIRPDLNLWSTFQIVSPLSETHDNSHQLFVIDRVIQFCSAELLRKVSDQMPSVFLFLGQDACIGHTWRIHLKMQFVTRTIMPQNGCSYESIDQPFKGFLLWLLLIFSNKTRFLTILHAMKQLVKRLYYASKVINESPVKVTESKEDLNIMVRLGWIVTLFWNGFNS